MKSQAADNLDRVWTAMQDRAVMTVQVKREMTEAIEAAGVKLRQSRDITVQEFVALLDLTKATAERIAKEFGVYLCFHVDEDLRRRRLVLCLDFRQHATVLKYPATFFEPGQLRDLLELGQLERVLTKMAKGEADERAKEQSRRGKPDPVERHGGG